MVIMLVRSQSQLSARPNDAAGTTYPPAASGGDAALVQQQLLESRVSQLGRDVAAAQRSYDATQSEMRSEMQVREPCVSARA